MRRLRLLGRVIRVTVERTLERLGGVAEAAILTRLTSRAKVRASLARGRIVRDARGRYALPGAVEAMRAANRLSGVLCLDSAARHRGWKLKHQPERPSIAVPRKRRVVPERRQGVRLVYVDLPADDIDGYATAPLRTVMDCAARLPFDEALTIADSALRAGEVTEAELRLAAGTRKALKKDCERYNALAQRSWVVLRFSWEHVMFEPEYVAEVLRSMVMLLTRQPLGPALDQFQPRLSA